MVTTADEARKIAQDTLNNELIIQVEGISEAINKAAASGKFEVDWYKRLNSRIRDYLHNLGYELHDYNELNEEYTTISWGK